MTHSQSFWSEIWGSQGVGVDAVRLTYENKMLETYSDLNSLRTPTGNAKIITYTKLFTAELIC